MNRQNKAMLDQVMVAGGVLKTAIPINDLDKHFPELFGANSKDTTSLSYSSVSWVFRCVNLRSDTISSLPRSFYRLGSPSEVDPPAIHAEVDFDQLFWLTEAARCLWGVSYWERDPGLHWLNPTTMSLILDEGNLAGFAQTTSGENFRLEELVYIPMFNPNDDIGPGIAPAETALAAAGLSVSLLEWPRAFFEHGAIPAVILTTDQRISQDSPELQRISAAWKKVTRGLAKAWETVVLSRGLKPTIISPSVKDLVIPALSKQVREEIAACFGVPITLLQQSASNFATARENRQSYYMDTIFPEATRIASALNKQLWNQLGYEMRFNFHEVEAIQQNEAEKASGISSLMKQTEEQYSGGLLSRERSVWLIEQLWSQMGLALPEDLPDHDNGDQVSLPITPSDIPVTNPTPAEPPSPQPALTPPPPQIASVGPNGDTIEEMNLKVIELRKDVRRWCRKVKSRGPDCNFSSEYIPYKTSRAIRLRLLNGQGDVFRPWLEAKDVDRVAEESMAEALLKIFTRYLPVIIAALEIGSIPALGDMYAEMRGALIPIYQQVISEQALANAADLGWGMDYEDILLDANSWSRARATELVALLAGTDSKRFSSIVTDLLYQNITPDAIPGLLLDLFGPIRANLTGITETTRAMREAAKELAESMRAEGIDVVERWLTAEDELVCELCAPLDHTTEEEWGQIEPGGPPVHYRCRCRIAVEYKRKWRRT